jgi:hypothetical protein
MRTWIHSLTTTDADGAVFDMRQDVDKVLDIVETLYLNLGSLDSSLENVEDILSGIQGTVDDTYIHTDMLISAINRME